MPLFTIPNRLDNKDDLNIIKTSKDKSKKLTSSITSIIELIKANIDKYLGKYKNEYIVIRDKETLENYITKAIEDGIIAIDTETTGRDARRDKLVGISIYSPSQKAAYIPFAHRSYITKELLPNQLSKEILYEQFTRIADAHIDIDMFNANFDLTVIWLGIGVHLICTCDGYLGSKLLNENEENGEGGLKPLHSYYVLGGKEDEFSYGDTIGNKITFDMIPIEYAYIYAAHDAIITLEYCDFIRKYLTPTSEYCIKKNLQDVAWVFNNIEMPLVDVILNMEMTGVRFDYETNKKFLDKYAMLLKEKEQAVYKEISKYDDLIEKYKQENPNHILSTPINLSSPKQMSILLYDILKVGTIDKDHPRGTGEKIIEKIDLPFTKALLDYRGFSKLISTYITSLPSYVEDDGRIHCVYKQYGAKTGRLSSTDPNLQNQPRNELRTMFIASEGNVLLSCDYSAQEVRIMAQMCGDEDMKRIYKEGKDLYAITATRVFHLPLEECVETREDGSANKEGEIRRNKCKQIVLGLNYDMGINALAERAGCDEKEAQIIKDSIFKVYKNIGIFQEDSKQFARDNGYVTTLWGRKRRLPEMSMPRYEFRWQDRELKDKEVPIELVNKYTRLLGQCGYNKTSVFKRANNEDGIWIIDNSSKIAKAERECVNARIQGRPIRFNCPYSFNLITQGCA